MFVRSAGGRGWVGPSWKSYLANQVDLPGGPFQVVEGTVPEAISGSAYLVKRCIEIYTRLDFL